MTWGITWGPGYRFFKCAVCKYEWKEKCRDCTSPSNSRCANPDAKPYCAANLKGGVTPHGHEMHTEWNTDAHGNLA